MQNGRTKELLIILARQAKLTGEKSRAQEYLKEALDFDREDTEIWTMLGDYQFEANEHDKAFQSYQAVLSLSEEANPECCLKLALLNIELEKYEVAYDLLMYTVKKIDLCLPWCLLGICCLRLGDLEEADVSFIQANSLDRWDSTIWGYSAIL